jgi:2-polyprenyl-3-methyl-5-hydroxy-6-metoxy-1,4-benzoquinol methylase
MNDLINLLSNVSCTLKGCVNEIDNFLKSNDFDLLKGLLLSKDWPQAAHNDQICNFNSVHESSFRAKNTLNVFDLNEGVLRGKRFLDFGCGRGFTTLEASRRGAISFGYDPFEKNFFKDRGDVNFFSDWGAVQKEVNLNGKFDYVFLYDVLDHVNGELIESIVSKVYSVCSNMVFLRCHPFCSRHGYHLHSLLNKAFIHLVFTPEELHSIGLRKVEHTLSIVNTTDYASFFIKKFKVISEVKITDPIDNFFINNPFIINKIATRWFYGSSREHALSNMSCSFLDFVLKPVEPFVIPS